MIWFLLAFVLLVGLLLWLPLQVEIDTREDVYKMRWRGISAVWVIPGERGWRVFFRLFFWQKEWKPSNTDAEKKSERKKVPGAKRKTTFTVRQGRVLFMNLLKALKVKRLWVNWDTGDFVRNAWLYPVFRAASRGERQLFINFLGQQELAILLQTRLGLLAVAVLRVFLSLKK